MVTLHRSYALWWGRMVFRVFHGSHLVLLSNLCINADLCGKPPEVQRRVHSIYFKAAWKQAVQHKCCRTRSASCTTRTRCSSTNEMVLGLSLLATFKEPKPQIWSSFFPPPFNGKCFPAMSWRTGRGWGLWLEWGACLCSHSSYHLAQRQLSHNTQAGRSCGGRFCISLLTRSPLAGVAIFAFRFYCDMAAWSRNQMERFVLVRDAGEKVGLAWMPSHWLGQKGYARSV